MQVEEYRIVPWDQDPSVPIGTDREFYIPPEVEAIANEVMTHYDMRVDGMTLITSKPDKGGAIWKIETDKGPRSLKVLHREPRRSLFSVYAQQWLVEQGARVPALIRTKAGELYVEAGHKLWIVTDWITLEPANKMDVEGAETLVYGLGEFHRASRGYMPPKFAQQSTRLYNWPKHYAKMIDKIGWFKDLASAYPETAGSALLLQVVDRFQQQARDAMARFEQSSFRKMVAKGERFWGLVHQDFGFSNGQMGPDGIWVIDLDGVSYDFPIRDLRKLITSTMDDMGAWDAGIIRRLIQSYHQANPLDRETYELLLNDMAFPNEFYKHIKEMIFDPELFMNTELEPILTRVLAAEETKDAVLADLAGDLPNYKPGSYEEPAERPLASRPMPAWQPSLPVMPDLEAPIPVFAESPSIVREAGSDNIEDAVLDFVADAAANADATIVADGEDMIAAETDAVTPLAEDTETRDAPAGASIYAPETYYPPIGAPIAAPAAGIDPIPLPLAPAVPAAARAAAPRSASRTQRRRRRASDSRRRKGKRRVRRSGAKTASRAGTLRKTKLKKSAVRRPARIAKRKVGKTRSRRTAKRA